MSFERDNVSGLKIDRPWKWLLVPGLIAQWLMYMFPSGSFRGVVADTRQAQSPLMTYLFSAVFYFGVVAVLISAVSGR